MTPEETERSSDHKKKKKKHKRKTTDSDDDNVRADGRDGVASSKKSQKEKTKKKEKKRKREREEATNYGSSSDRKDRKQKKKRSAEDVPSNKQKANKGTGDKKYFPFEYEHILAPMVGASELAFRLLCRKYGATLAYTPMMSASQFVEEAAAIQPSGTATIANSNICEFQTIPEDRPLVCHFSANKPKDFAKAAALVEPFCDAIDLNLGCPQRTAFVGHFGSYLLGEEDRYVISKYAFAVLVTHCFSHNTFHFRQLVLDIVRAGSKAVSIPIFVKIRLLDSIEETIELCHQLRDAGASLIAIHARCKFIFLISVLPFTKLIWVHLFFATDRASWERTGPGARDGPALLDQIALVKQSMPDFPIISNGNVISYEDVVANRETTSADGIMSAEGILNNPALYLPRHGDPSKEKNREITIHIPSPLKNCGVSGQHCSNGSKDKLLRKLYKKLRKIESAERKASNGFTIDEGQEKLIKDKPSIQVEIEKLEKSTPKQSQESTSDGDVKVQTTTMMLHDLAKTGNDKVALAKEYLCLVRRYPMKIRSVVFHTRRMCKDVLEQYQLLEECIACMSIDAVDAVLTKCAGYIKNPKSFKYDQEKAARDKEALERKKREEGKRKSYEGRMIRKAKREGLADLEHYLRIGAEVPTKEVINKLRSLSKDAALAVWKKDHSQHCMSYHLDAGGCKRDRACAFLHVEAKGENTFDEVDEVAG
jgi:tRNA-dihydrouridine synthase 1